jgi:hypothetical protein
LLEDLGKRFVVDFRLLVIGRWRSVTACLRHLPSVLGKTII